MAFKLFDKFLGRPKGEEQGHVYKYSVLASVLLVFIPEEYFFPDFISTTEFLEKQSFYNDIKNVILDFQQCKLLHGLGMGLEVQSYYESAKAVNKKVFWVGNKGMHEIIIMMLEPDYSSTDIIPYLPSVPDLSSLS
ncbi:hypothetical protein J4D99_05670 [Siccationidurans ginsengisoli]|nr:MULTISPECIES: hypothetical protein [unclassified Hymenobacter]MBO2030874.1 hypothetical protein [Hymenobacter sp. BT559]